jgi:hypothetical protein
MAVSNPFVMSCLQREPAGNDNYLIDTEEGKGEPF